MQLYFGEGMHYLWGEHTKIFLDKKEQSKDFLLSKKGDKYKSTEEKMFYIPAQRILAIADGRPRTFTEFDETVPYVLKYFSDAIRQMLQKELIKTTELFPSKQRLSEVLRNLFNENIFHDYSVSLEEQTGQRKLRMEVNDSSIPFMTWSAGQKEFMPLLLAFYWLCPPSRASKKDKLEFVVIEEPEMGLHLQAILAVMLQVIELLSRGYKVIISTHSNMILEFAWAFQMIQQTDETKDRNGALIKLFGLNKTTPVLSLFKNLEKRSIKTYFFNHTPAGVISKDISSLDAADTDEHIADWGNLTSFSTKASEIVASIL